MANNETAGTYYVMRADQNGVAVAHFTTVDDSYTHYESEASRMARGLSVLEPGTHFYVFRAVESYYTTVEPVTTKTTR